MADNMKSMAMNRDLKRKKSLSAIRSDCRNYSSPIGSEINRIIKGPASYLGFGMRYLTSLKIGDKSLLFWGKTIEEIRLSVKGKRTHNICDIMLGGGLCFF